VADAAPASLELRGIVKIYPALRALDGIDLTLLPGEIHALCGENGAGKSTLARIAAGKILATEGSVVASGPVGLVHQHFELVDRLRVWENVVLGREPRRGGRIDAAAARERVRELSRRYALAVDPDAVVETLPVGIAQRVEILRELAKEPSVLVLDEPTAVLAATEIDALFATLHTLAARGAAILVITHKLQEVIGHADRVTVIRNGRIVSSALTATTSLGAIAHAMVGGDVPALATRTRAPLRPAFVATNLCAGTGAHALHDASFEVCGGEIVGIAGVEGNGQAALSDAIAGILAYEGEMRLRDRPLPPDPAARLVAGVRVIPQDRRREALVLSWNIVDNVALGDHARAPLRRGFNVERGAREALARRVVERFDIRTPSIRACVASLSGGNQQKVVVGRALSCEPALLVAYQPTRGVDIGAAALLQSRLIEARNDGTAVLLVSFELDEILALSDRVLVMYRGKIAGEFERGSFDRARIGALMAGGA
jgi:general nucleoside transport system ATP-binding protein